MCVDLGVVTVLAGCDWGARVRRVGGMERVDWDCEFIRGDGGRAWDAMHLSLLSSGLLCL